MGTLGVVTEQVWSFYPATNTWKQEIDFPGTSRRFPVAWAIHDRGYIGTGTNGINLNDFWQFNPIDNTIGIEEFTAEFKIYPNPIIQFLTIENTAISSLNGIEVQLLQMNGTQVFKVQLENEQHKIDLSTLPPGAYLLQLHRGASKLKEQIILKP